MRSAKSVRAIVNFKENWGRPRNKLFWQEKWREPELFKEVHKCMALLSNHKIPSMENAVLYSEKHLKLLCWLHPSKIHFTFSYTQINTDFGEHLLNDDSCVNIISYLLNSNLIISSSFPIELFLYSRITYNLLFIYNYCIFEITIW